LDRWFEYDGIKDDLDHHVAQTVEAIQSASPTGRIPVGWYTGRIGEDTRASVVRLYRERGWKLLYDSDAYNDDLPYWVTVDNAPHLVIPYTLDVNDMKFSVVTD
jgi:peptidoglycan/xylan/chitin deacetylase (PgdA/CDA1 family)